MVKPLTLPVIKNFRISKQNDDNDFVANIQAYNVSGALNIEVHHFNTFFMDFEKIPDKIKNIVTYIYIIYYSDV